MDEQKHEHHDSAKGGSGERHGHSKHHSSSRKSSKIRKFIKKHKSHIINVAVILVAVVAVVLMGLFGDNLNLSGRQPGGKDPVNTDPVQTEDSATTVQIELAHFTGDVLLISNSAHSFANRDMSAPLMEVIHRYASVESRQDLGLPVSISYSVNGKPSGLTVGQTTLEVADNPAFTNARAFSSTEESATVRVYHLKTGTRYYYRVGVMLSDGTTTYAISTFDTAESPRILSIGGIVNVRDVGGWKTTDGKTVKQGLLYRGSELDGAVEAGFKLTPAGQSDMITLLGIRTEMDLRSGEENAATTQPLGANVKQIRYEGRFYSQILNPNAYETMRGIFSDLANADHYPMYLHCTYGSDRTGTVCYLLLTLLGVSEEDARREYELSALYYAWADSDAMDTFVRDLHTLPGDTMQEKVEYYLQLIGVTEQEIAGIRSIFLAQ